jgi:hypothetical protein
MDCELADRLFPSNRLYESNSAHRDHAFVSRDRRETVSEGREFFGLLAT